MARNTMLRNAYNGLIRARERQARSYAAGILLGLDDETLARAGFDRRSLSRGEFGSEGR